MKRIVDIAIIILFFSLLCVKDLEEINPSRYFYIRFDEGSVSKEGYFNEIYYSEYNGGISYCGFIFEQFTEDDTPFLFDMVNEPFDKITIGGFEFEGNLSVTVIDMGTYVFMVSEDDRLIANGILMGYVPVMSDSNVIGLRPNN